MKPIAVFTALFGLSAAPYAQAQTATTARNRICVDVAHQQVFWGDPSDMPGVDAKKIERVRYMTGELTKTAAAVDASLSYLKKAITPDGLKGCDLVFIHIPSARYTAAEITCTSTVTPSATLSTSQ